MADLTPANYVLYVLMRTDLASMNAGKAMAQSNHAYGALKKAIKTRIALQPHYLAWMDSTPQEFGTTLVLGGSEREIGLAPDRAYGLAGKTSVGGWVVDPTYPLRDGDVTHLINLRTCAFLFCKKEHSRELLSHLDLHP